MAEEVGQKRESVYSIGGNDDAQDVVMTDADDAHRCMIAALHLSAPGIGSTVE
jgi:hypothetical protein